MMRVSFDAASALATHDEKDEDMIAIQGTVRNGQIVLDDPVGFARRCAGRGVAY